MKQYWFLIMSILLFCSTTYGQFASDAVGILDNLYGFGARSTGMATAYTAVADDYSASYWNPAGLAQIRKMEFFAGVSHLTYETDASFYNTDATTSDNFTKLSSLGIVFPVPTTRGSLVFSLGFHRVKEFDQMLRFSGINPQQSGLNFDVDSVTVAFFDENTRQQEQINQDGSLHNWSFAGAIDVSPRVSIGLSVNFWSGTLNYAFNFVQDDINQAYELFPADFTRFDLSQRLIADYSAFQLKVGTLLRASEQLRLGFTIGLPTTFNVVEEFTSRNTLEFDNGDVFENTDYFINDDGFSGEVSSEFEYDVSTPFQFSAGASFTLSDLLLSTAFEYIDLSQVKFEVPDDISLSSDYDDLLDENSLIRDLYDGQMKLKIGAEYTFRDLGLSLRAGYLTENSPFKDARDAFNRNFYTAGFGYMIDNQFRIDVAYVSGSWENTSEDIFTPGEVSENITYQKLFFSTRLTF